MAGGTPAPTRLAHQAGMAAHLGRAPRGQRMGAGEVFGYRAEMFLIR